jgi:hypothetical protein
MNKPKLKLELDGLTVESFDTISRGPGPKGTVLARENTIYPCASVDQCPSVGYSCPGDCFATYDTDCFTNNGTCTEPTCRGTISCQRTVWPVTCAC